MIMADVNMGMRCEVSVFQAVFGYSLIQFISLITNLVLALINQFETLKVSKAFPPHAFDY